MNVRSDNATAGLGEVLVPLQYVEQMVDVRAAMPGVHLAAKPRGIERHGGKPDGIDVNALSANCECKLFGVCVIPEPDRDDRRLSCNELVVQIGHALDEIALIGPQLPAALRLIANNVDRC